MAEELRKLSGKELENVVDDLKKKWLEKGISGKGISMNIPNSENVEIKKEIKSKTRKPSGTGKRRLKMTPIYGPEIIKPKNLPLDLEQEKRLMNDYNFLKRCIELNIIGANGRIDTTEKKQPVTIMALKMLCLFFTESIWKEKSLIGKQSVRSIDIKRYLSEKVDKEDSLYMSDKRFNITTVATILEKKLRGSRNSDRFLEVITPVGSRYRLFNIHPPLEKIGYVAFFNAIIKGITMHEPTIPENVVNNNLDLDEKAHDEKTHKDITRTITNKTESGVKVRIEKEEFKDPQTTDERKVTIRVLISI